MIKFKFNTQYSSKMKKFIGVYDGQVNDPKGPCTNINMEKEVNKLVDIYAKFIGSDLEVHKIHGAPGTPLSKSQIEEPTYMDKYRSFMGQLLWHITKVLPEVANMERDLALHMSLIGT